MASRGDEKKRLLGRGARIPSKAAASSQDRHRSIEQPPTQRNCGVANRSETGKSSESHRGVRQVASASSVSPPRAQASTSHFHLPKPAARIGRGESLFRQITQMRELQKQEAKDLLPAVAKLSIKEIPCPEVDVVPVPKISTPKSSEIAAVAPEPVRRAEDCRGKAGNADTFVANHIPVRIKAGYSIFEYHVTFTPEVDSRAERHKLVSLLMNNNVDCLRVKTFDGAKLFLPRQLQPSQMAYTVCHPLNDATYEISLKFVGENSPEECIQHLNILLRRVMRVIGMVQIGRNYYNPALKTSVTNQNLSVWPGFITSICDFDGGYMLCAETSHRILQTNSVLSIMYEVQRNYHQNYREEITKMLLGIVIMTDYNNKTYRIDDILWDRNPTCTFKIRDEDVSFINYYDSQYQIKIKDLQQPLLLHRAKLRIPNQAEQERIVCLIPELCYMTGLTDEMRKDFGLMKTISAHTRLSPAARQSELISFIEHINGCEKARERLDGWGVELVPELMKVGGRILAEERIFLGNNKSVMAGKQVTWSRDSANNKVLTPISISKWVIIYVNKNRSSVRNFCDNLMIVGPPLGMELQQPYFYELNDDKNIVLANALTEIITPDLQLVVIVNPTPRDDRYNLIKKITCCDKAVPSQVINARTISDAKKLRSVAQKIALQINCKLGGELWSLAMPMTNLMVCGIDVYHNKASQHKSVLGLVSSLNATLTKWCCDAKFQTKGEEIGCHLNVSLIKAIKKYYEANHQFPSKIIFIRDGVGDSQLDYVSKFEIEQFKKAFQSFTDYNPEFMVVVVQKRINTRIFYQNGSQGRNYELTNPPPGTVVDHTVTRKYLFDFLLISQHVTQGSVSPTHYIVLFNNIKLKNGLMNADQVQQIMYKLTHMYYNWPGTIRVPSPTQYAQKLASLVGQNIQKEPNEELLDRLFFL